MVTATYAVQMSFDATVVAGKLTANTWTTVPTIAPAGITMRRGIMGTTPVDRVAGPGTLEFETYNNPIGYYSPGHASVRSGFGYGIPCRLIGVYATTGTRPLFTGRIRRIDPVPGVKGSRRVKILVQDYMADLTDARLLSVAPQIDQQDIDVLNAILAAVPAAIAPGVIAAFHSTDTYPYCLDDLVDGTSPITGIARLAASSWAKAFVGVTGQFFYFGRLTLQALTSVATFGNADLSGLDIGSALEAVYNRVRVTVHPRHFVAGIELFDLAAPVRMEPAGITRFWGTYRDPSNPQTLLGGFGFDAFAAVTGWVVNSQEDGLGTDRTSDVTGAAYPFASTVYYELSNNSPDVLWLTQCRTTGSAIYEDGPVTVESIAADPVIGDQSIPIDMPYQDDANIAFDLATYVRLGSTAVNVRSFTLFPRRSDAAMSFLQAAEITNVVTLSETVTGLAAQRYMVHGIELAIVPGAERATFTVVPFVQSQAWILDSATYSQLDSSTILGFAA